MAVNAAYIKSKIDFVRSQIGRDVIFYLPNRVACDLCQNGYYDPHTDTSSNFQCPLCKGAYWVNSTTQVTVLARIHWSNDEAITATPGGKYYIGDCTLGINTCDIDTAEAAQAEGGAVLVDGHKMSITKILPVGAPTINRYRVVCTNMGERPTR